MSSSTGVYDPLCRGGKETMIHVTCVKLAFWSKRVEKEVVSTKYSY